jgi:hypothetical protein
MSPGAGIGSGNGTIHSRVYTVKIAGGGFVLQGSVGLDCRYCNSLILGNSSFACSGISFASCLRGQNVTFTNGPLIVRTRQFNFVEFDRVLFSGYPELRIEYLSTSIRETLIGLPNIHIRQSEFPFSSIYELYISPSAETNRNCNPSFRIDSAQIRGIGFSVPSHEGYTISYSSLSTFETGYLVHDSMAAFDALFNNDTFYSKATPMSAMIPCARTAAPSPTTSKSLPATASNSPPTTDEFTSDVVGMSQRKRIIIRFAGATFALWD